MKIKKRKITKDIYVLHFENQRDLASTFLRFQEHYESPKFMGKIFTLKEFKDWYKKVKKKKRFTYYKDWNGFNIPSRILNFFRDGYFNPLSKREKQLLKLFENEEEDFYVIAVYGHKKNHHNVLLHEIAHGFFSVDRTYREKVLKIIRKYNLKKIKEELLKLGGYNKEVLEDEIQAYYVSLHHELKKEIPEKLIKEIKSIFNLYSPIFAK